MKRIYDSHGGAEFVSDLRKVDRETVSNESKENQKPKNFPGLSPRSLGLDHHTLF